MSYELAYKRILECNEPLIRDGAIDERGRCCAVGILLYGHIPPAERINTAYGNLPPAERPKRKQCWAEPEHEILLNQWKLKHHEITDLLVVNEDFHGTPEERRARALEWLESKIER